MGGQDLVWLLRWSTAWHQPMLSRNNRTVDSRPCLNRCRGCYPPPPPSLRTRVGVIVPRAVVHQVDQASVWSALWKQLIHQGVEGFYQLAVIEFPSSAHAALGAKPIARRRQEQRSHVIIHTQAITHDQVISVQLVQFLCCRFKDQRANQYLQVPPRLVIVALISKNH